MPSIQFSGLASGLDTQAMVRAILDFESQPLQRMQARQQTYSQRKAALETLRGKLNEFESALRDLSSARTFRGRNTTVSDATILRATAGAGAETGLFEIEVSELAAASKIKSDGLVASDQALVSDGTITLQAGSNDLITVDVSAADGSNSLQAVRDAINAADAGVQAAIVFDGTNYRLSVRSEETGTSNALTVTDTTNLNLDDAGNVVSTAANAQLVVDGIDVVSSNNKVTGVIPGVTLDLLAETTTGEPITVEIAQDVDGVVEATQEIVSTYNDIANFFSSQFDRENPGPLAADGTARQIQSRIQTMFTGGVTGIALGEIRSLSAIGVSFDGKTGEARLDTSELRELLETRFEDVGDLFLSSGDATSPRIQYVSSASATDAGTYSVEITQAAEQAGVTGSAAMSALSQDETLTIQVGDDSTEVNLTSGQTLAEVADAINQALRDADISATAIDSGGSLRIVTRQYGSAAGISVTSDRVDPGDGTGTGFTTSAATDTGVDVAGRIDGVDATGSGQLLTAAEDEDAAGLTVKVTATAAEVTANGGDFGTISFSKGLVNSLVDQVDLMTRFGDGPLDLARESLESRIESVSKDIERFEVKLSMREASLVRQFASAERAISLLQSQQASLGGFTVL